MHNPSSNKLLNSLPVVEAFSFVIPLMNDPEAVPWISSVLGMILEKNEEAQEKFSTSEFVKIFQGMEKYATTEEAKTKFQNTLLLIAAFDFAKFVSLT